MTYRMSHQSSATCLWIVGLLGVLLSVSLADAKSSQSSSGKSVNAMACDYRAHPTITTVSPTHVKPGQKITISGKNFGTKQCFHSVSFGPKSTNAWTYVSPTTVEATVPDLRPGTVPVNVSTEGGTLEYTLDVSK